MIFRHFERNKFSGFICLQYILILFFCALSHFNNFGRVLYSSKKLSNCVENTYKYEPIYLVSDSDQGHDHITAVRTVRPLCGPHSISFKVPTTTVNTTVICYDSLLYVILLFNVLYFLMGK